VASHPYIPVSLKTALKLLDSRKVIQYFDLSEQEWVDLPRANLRFALAILNASDFLQAYRDDVEALP